MSIADKPYSPACERNREPIFRTLTTLLPAGSRVLEIGSGSGQHAVYFAAQRPDLHWQCSDVPAHLPGIRLWLDEAALENTPAPLTLDVRESDWPAGPWDAVYTANTLHIMGWPEVERLFAGLPPVLSADGRLFVYGPFMRDGRHTSESNARFDAMLRQQNPAQGVRDLAAVDRLAGQAGLERLGDFAMPANNRLLAWQRRG